MIAGIDWAINNHTNRPAVANMSLGGGTSTTLDNAVISAASLANGIKFVIAAGNDAVSLGEVTVKGRAEPVEIFKLA